MQGRVMASGVARIVMLTVSLIVAGAVFGAGVALISYAVSHDPTRGSSVWDRVTFVIVASVGAALGAVLGPLAGWTLLRRTALWLAVILPSVTTVVGGVLGTSVFPLGPVFGAIVGFCVGAAVLAVLGRLGATPGVPRARGGMLVQMPQARDRVVSGAPSMPCAPRHRSHTTTQRSR